jgi:orotate phosphoribosyltransferase
MKSKFGPTQFAAYMIANGIIRISEHGFPIRGVQTKSPILVDSMGMVQIEMVRHISDAMTYDMPHRTEIVAGSRFGALIMNEVARVSGFRKLPIILDDHGEISHLDRKSIEGKNIVLITDIIATGTHAADAVSLIRSAGGSCENVYTVFDYGFHLSSHVMSDVNIKSLLTFEQFHEARVASPEQKKVMEDWIEEHHYLFGEGNRKELKGMAKLV